MHKTEAGTTGGVTCEEPPAVQPPLTEGGRGWLVVLGGFVMFLVWSGFLKGMGVVLPSMTADLTRNTGVTGEIVAVVAGVRSLVGPLAGPLGDKLGYRPVVMVMSLIAATGIVSASFAKTSLQFSICLALISGVSFSTPLILTKAMIGRYFDKRFALAMSLASAGDSVSMIVMPPLVQLFLFTYGWRGALLLYGGLCLHLVAVGALLRDPPSQDGDRDGYQSIKDNEEIHDSQHEADANAGKAKSLRETFNLSILTRLQFWVVCIVMVGTYLIGISWYLYFIPHAEAKGFHPSQAVGFVMAAGVGQILTKIIVGKLIDLGIVSIRAGLVLSITTCSVTLAIDPLIHTFWPMMIITTLFGSFFGLVYCLVDVFAKEIAGVDGLASAFGYIDLIGGIARIFLGFAPGMIYEKTGSYDIAFVILGCGYLTVLLPLIGEWFISRRAHPLKQC